MSTGMPRVEVALTMLHAGGKFDKATYKVSGGLHGVGVSVVNALSEKLEVWVDRDGKRHHMAFERGETKKKLEVIGKAKGTGTTVWFKPDTEIFTETRFDYATVANRLRELAFLNKALTITLKDERKGQLKQETFFYKGGLAEFVKYLLGNRKSLHPKPITFETTREGVEVEGAVQYDDGYNDNTFSFVNNINTHGGGAQGARAGPQEERARGRVAARQARRLLGLGSRAHGALSRRGRFRGRLGQAGPRPQLPGDPPPAGQDPQRPEGPDRQDPLQRGDPHDHHGDRHGRGRGFQAGRRALPQDHHHDGRRRGRRPHPHPAPHVLLQGDEVPDRRRVHLHRAAAAVSRRQGQGGVLRLRREGARRLREAAHERRGRSGPRERPDPALPRAGRDESRSAAQHHDGSGAPHPPQGDHGGRV